MKLIFACFVAIASSSALANDLLLTTGEGKSGTVTSIDLVSDGTATMLQFNIATGSDAKSVDLTNCIASLPKSHKGECSINSNGEVLGLVYNDEGVSLPKGVINIGKLSVRGSASFTVTQFLAADKTNAHVEGTSKVSK
jgi:hypothetical protein